MTRVKDTDKGELLTFKELSWQTVRIEAKSTKNDDLTPLRLITNQARARITIKKKLSGENDYTFLSRPPTIVEVLNLKSHRTCVSIFLRKQQQSLKKHE